MVINPSFIKPRYDSGGFAGIPNRIKEAFESKKYDAVVLFFIDAFGWRFFEKFQENPFIKRIAKNGKIEKLTSQFPSTTAAHVTTIHTGLTVGQTGVYEWYYYEPLVDAVIAPLPFTFAGNDFRDLSTTGIHPPLLYPRGIFYEQLKKLGVDSFVFGTNSIYSRAVMSGATIRPYKTLSEAFSNVSLLLKKQTEPTYIHLYFDKIDTISHLYGPTSFQAENEIETFLLMMEHHFDKMFKGNKKILFLMTADHGMAEVDPKRTTYLNQGPAFQGIERFLKINNRGQLLIPAGSARDMFLYVKDYVLDDAQEFLSERLQGKADVVKTEELIHQGYFGPEISERFRERVGNLVLLSYLNETCWWHVPGQFEMFFHGHHGGLTPQEMETILYSMEL